jgi:hypothetical protein
VLVGAVHGSIKVYTSSVWKAAVPGRLEVPGCLGVPGDAVERAPAGFRNWLGQSVVPK